MPELAHRLVEVHHADEKGYCRGCTTPGGTLFVRWPCGLLPTVKDTYQVLGDLFAIDRKQPRS